MEKPNNIPKSILDWAEDSDIKPSEIKEFWKTAHPLTRQLLVEMQSDAQDSTLATVRLVDQVVLSYFFNERLTKVINE